MPRTERANQQIREQRRVRILEGAAEVFARKGLVAARVADIAAATAMSQGLIYRYFAGKDELFAAVVERATAGTAALAREALAQSGSPWERLHWFTARLVPHQYQQPAYALVVSHALTSEAVPPAVRDSARRHLDALREVVTGLIVEGQARGEVLPWDPSHLALVYLAALHGLAATAAFIDTPAGGFPDAETLLLALRPVPRPQREQVTRAIQAPHR